MPLLLSLLLACSGPKDPAAGDPGDTGDTGDTAASARTPAEWVEHLGGMGEHGVGYTEESVTYTDPAGAPRTLRLAIWYPSPDAEGEEVRYQGFVEAPGVMRDAAPLDGVHPLIVFSHGSQGYAEASGFLLSALASHGWVVASPDHTNNTTADGPDRTTEIYFQRPADITAVIDHMADAWGERVDLSTLVGMGHSFGGYGLHAAAGADYAIEALAPGCYDGSDTSPFCSTMTPAYEAIFAQGFHEDRLRAVLPIGAGDLRLFTTEGIQGIQVPGLWVTGELEGATAQAEELFAVMQGGPGGAGLNRRGLVAGADHNFCIDLTAVLEPDAPIEDEEGFRVIRVLAGAWARRHGLGDAAMDPILDGEEPVSGALTLYR